MKTLGRIIPAIFVFIVGLVFSYIYMIFYALKPLPFNYILPFDVTLFLTVAVYYFGLYLDEGKDSNNFIQVMKQHKLGLIISMLLLFVGIAAWYPPAVELFLVLTGQG